MTGDQAQQRPSGAFLVCCLWTSFTCVFGHRPALMLEQENIVRARMLATSLAATGTELARCSDS